MYEYEDETEYPYIEPVKRRATAGQDVTFRERKTEEVPQPTPPKKHNHTLFWIGCGMCVFLALWMGITLVVLPWWHGMENQWHYGDQPHVSELTVDVGHGGVSTLLAFDSDGQLTVLEIVNRKAIVYTGGNFIGGDKKTRIITLSLDTSRAKPNLFIHVVGMDGAFVLFNTGTSFQWTSS